MQQQGDLIRDWGIIEYDWANAKALWSNQVSGEIPQRRWCDQRRGSNKPLCRPAWGEKDIRGFSTPWVVLTASGMQAPMDCEERLVTQAVMTKVPIEHKCVRRDGRDARTFIACRPVQTAKVPPFVSHSPHARPCTGGEPKLACLHLSQSCQGFALVGVGRTTHRWTHFVLSPLHGCTCLNADHVSPSMTSVFRYTSVREKLDDPQVGSFATPEECACNERMALSKHTGAHNALWSSGLDNCSSWSHGLLDLTT